MKQSELEQQFEQELLLSLEATAVKTKYASLFTDEEINHCLSLLCEGGHYRAR